MDLEEYHCPLLDIVIHMDLCYEIQFEKDSASVKFGHSKAQELCPTCPYNQLTGGIELSEEDVIKLIKEYNR